MRQRKQRAQPPPRAQPNPPGGRLFDRVFYLATLILALGVYRGLFDNYLFNDDFLWMSQARLDMGRDVLTHQVFGFFRPFINLSFFVTERLAPGNLRLYYFTNILLHWLNVVLLFHLASALLRNRTIAAAASVYFLVASVHFGAVAWISARTTLIDTAFLLLSLLLVVHAGTSRLRLTCALGLYTFALASKETAIVGLFLIGLIHFFVRHRKDISVPVSAISAYAAVSVVYLLVRTLAIGGLTQDNWGPGLHMFGNLAGGVLFQYYSLGIAAIPALATVGLSAAPGWIEVLALPVAAVLLIAAKIAGKSREMRFALAWIALSLLPVALLKFRFFASDSIPHTRYYYLSSFGVCLSIVILLSALWTAHRSRHAAMAFAAFAFLALCVSEIAHVQKLEHRWEVLTGEYRMVVSLVEENLDQARGMRVCVVDDPPIEYAYLNGALRMERPGWKLVAGDGSEQFARDHQPCLYLKFLRQGERVGISVARLE